MGGTPGGPDGPKLASPRTRTPSASRPSGAPSRYSVAMASTSGSVLPRFCSNHGRNHGAFSASARHSSGNSRTHTRVVTGTPGNCGSAKVRSGPSRVTVRAPSVKVASTVPAASTTVVRAGASRRRKRRSLAALAASAGDAPTVGGTNASSRTAPRTIPPAPTTTASTPMTARRVASPVRRPVTGRTPPRAPARWPALRSSRGSPPTSRAPWRPAAVARAGRPPGPG